MGASIFLAVQLLVATFDWKERPNAIAYYLIWNFGTTILWIIEVTFRAYYSWRTISLYKAKPVLANIALVVEWTLAVFFTYDSIRLLIEWKIKKQDVEEDLFEVFLNIFGFAYITVITYREYESVRHQNYQSIADNDYGIHAGTSLVV